MRPRGEIRQVLVQAAVQLTAERGAFTWMEAAERAQVGYSVARSTIKNMADAGELMRAGSAKSAHSGNWVTLYEASVADELPIPQPWGGIEALADVLSSWPHPCNGGDK